MSGKEKNALTEKLSFIEKLTFGIGDAGANFVWSFLAAFMTIYLTDTVGLGAALIGTIIFVCRLFDGVSDLFMGSLIDNTNSKMGKAKPWVFWTAPILGVLVYMIFNVPSSLSEGYKYAYVAIIYFFISAVFYTANNVAYSSLTSFMTNRPEDRVSLGSIRFVCAITAVLFINGYTNRLVEYFGGGQPGWQKVSLIYGILCVLFLMITGYFVKERNIAKTTKSDNRVSFKDSFSALLKSRYFYLIFLLYLFMYIRISSSGAAIFYAQYVLKNPDTMAILSFASQLPSILVLIFYGKITGKFGIRKTMIAGTIMALIGYIVASINSENLTLLVIGLAIGSMGAVPLTAAASALVADMADYVYWETNVPVQGVAFSTTSAGMKLGTGIASALLGWVLAWGGYIPNSINQPGSSIFSMKLLFLYFPIIMLVLILVIVVIIDIEKHMPKVRKELAERE